MSFLSKLKSMFGGAGVDAPVDPSKSCDCGHEHGGAVGVDAPVDPNQHKCDCGEGECMTQTGAEKDCDCGHDHA